MEEFRTGTTHLCVIFVCKKGRHRSVAAVELLGHWADQIGLVTQVRHLSSWEGLCASPQCADCKDDALPAKREARAATAAIANRVAQRFVRQNARPAQFDRLRLGLARQGAVTAASLVRTGPAPAPVAATAAWGQRPLAPVPGPGAIP
eukprot:1514364-Amphidinium_carterae.1